MVCAFFSNLLSVIIDVVLAVNSDSKIAPANIQRMQRMRAKTDLGALSPYLKEKRKAPNYCYIYMKTIFLCCLHQVYYMYSSIEILIDLLQYIFTTIFFILPVSYVSTNLGNWRTRKYCYNLLKFFDVHSEFSEPHISLIMIDISSPNSCHSNDSPPEAFKHSSNKRFGKFISIRTMVLKDKIDTYFDKTCKFKAYA